VRRSTITRGDRLETLFCCPSQAVNESRIVVDYSDFVAAAQPDEIRKALAANAEQIASAGRAHGSGHLSSMRYARYKGHQIRVRTTYEITVDGRPFAFTSPSTTTGECITTDSPHATSHRSSASSKKQSTCSLRTFGNGALAEQRYRPNRAASQQRTIPRRCVPRQD